MVHANLSPSFAELLSITPPREVSGQRSSNRFAFQQSWALRLTLELHEKPDDYCVLFDVHDDVVTLDHATAPTKADFYQIKTKTTGNWTPHQLTKQEASRTVGNPPLPSMLGKLYEHYVRFPAHVRRLTIVSNAHFDVKMAVAPAGTDRDSICLSDLEATELQGISDKLTTEHGLSLAPAGLSIAHLETTSLSLTDHETHAEGHVSTFLSKQGDGSISPHPFYKAVRAEIQRRNNKECSPTTFADLLKYKGLTRAQLQAMIDSVMSQRGQEDLLALIRQKLTEEGYNFLALFGVLESVRMYFAKRQDRTNLLIADATKRAQREFSGLPASARSSATPLTDAIAQLAAVPAKEWEPIRAQYSENFLLGMFAVVIYEQGLSAAGSQPEEEVA